MDKALDNISDYEKALQFEQANDYSRAFELFQKCLSDNDGNKAEILFHAGWCVELGQGLDKESALPFYQQAVEFAKTPELRINSLFGTGWLLMQDKEYVNAAASFKQAIDNAKQANIKNETYQHATYWYAVCVETQGCYIEAIEWYRVIQKTNPMLSPESLLREIVCLTHIGSYDEALRVCLKFNDTAPQGFDDNRYKELAVMVKQERDILARCLSA